MHVGVGFSNDSDTDHAGVEAARMALDNAGRSDPDLILLFSTAWHDPYFLRSVIASVVGPSTVIVGGGAVGVITNDYYGYSGEQVGLAAMWMDGEGCSLFAEDGLVENEDEVGVRLGRRLAAHAVTAATPAMLFYDAINRTHGDVRLNMATPLLAGLEKGLGFLPAGLVGAGLQGDFESSPTMQWTGGGLAEHSAMVMTFSSGVRIDSIIMHGCRPAGEYYTVTKADRQTILEIDGEPALPYIESRLVPSLPAEAFPFFMIFGVNRDPNSKFNEHSYANRLCLAIDKKRGGIVMFEPDMVEGTRFQVMYRSLDLNYIPPKIEYMFNKQENRRPAFAFYIDCAGRADRFSAEMEDAVVVQKAVAGRVPLLGIYSGVEIAPVMGVPRPLDWTGVFCLFSVPE